MANKCPSCNKFATLEFQEPEEESFEVENLDHVLDNGAVVGNVHATVYISRNSACCGETVKEASLEMSEDITIEHDKLKDHLVEKEGGGWTWKEGCELTAACDDLEQVEESGKTRRFGASLDYQVTCECGKGDELHEGTLEEMIEGADMDEA